MDTKNSFASEKRAYYAVSALVVVITAVAGVTFLMTGRLDQFFTTKIAFVDAWLAVMLVEGAMFALSLVSLQKADAMTRKYELGLIRLLRQLIDTRGFSYFLKSLAKNPSGEELLAGFKEQIVLAHACLEMIVPTANASTRALLAGIVTDKINRVIPAKGSEEKWRELLAEFQKSLEIKTTA